MRYAPDGWQVFAAIATYRFRGAYRSSSTPRIIGTQVPPTWVAVTLPAHLSALAMSSARSPQFDALTNRLFKAQICLGVQVRQ